MHNQILGKKWHGNERGITTLQNEAIISIVPVRSLKLRIARNSKLIKQIKVIKYLAKKSNANNATALAATIILDTVKK